MVEHRQLSPEELWHRCDPQQFKFETTEEVPPLEGTIGQERAITAVEFGLGIDTHGFNLFVAGRPGTGKSSSVREIVDTQAREESVPSDWVYVYNFDDPLRPKAMRLSQGRAHEFAHDMDDVVRAARNELPRAFESENYEQRKSETMQGIQKRRDEVFSELQQQASQLGFSIEMTPIGIVTVPTRDNKPLSREEFDSLSEKEKEDIKQKSNYLEQVVNQTLTKIRQLEKEAQDRLRELDREIALFAVGHLLEDLRSKYKACEVEQQCKDMLDYLQKVQDDIVENVEDFRQAEKKQQLPLPMAAIGEASEAIFDKYKVNVLVSNEAQHGAPVVVENNPTYYNLFGKIEYRARFGFMTTDHNLIRAGAIQRANGGYLILQALDVLLNPFAWDGLKRTLRAREARVENIAEQYGLIPTATPKPEPIPLDVKVILIGNPMLYYLLFNMDEDFRKLFKVKADFDIEMDRNDKHIDQYAQFISKQCQEHRLKHFDRSAVARVVEFGSRLIEDKERMSTKFIDIADLVSEASFWAGRNGNGYVTAEDVERAIEHKEYRSRMVEDKIQRLIEEEVIMIDSAGSVTGQANGLSIYSLGDYTFGRPSRITCRTSVGRGGIIDIQRETEMGGRIHSKGVMILNGYLTGKYAQDKPLTLSATLAFEQLYEEVEGDSASSTELYTLLSSLAELPLRQDVAITGSVNQRGEIQPIGGVNRKIEGFFEVCKARGLTGSQGVIIPHQNVRHLMLKEEVIQAVRDGKFHVWPVRSIDEGIEILTGVPAGEQRADGSYPEDSVHYLVNSRLQDMANKVKEFGVTDGFVPREKKQPVRVSPPDEKESLIG
ncbi:MAG: AAA family ATPase [Armatimonadetes bacterium]|nr:AAA family ATPase [Armatimonadota bacterium]